MVVSYGYDDMRAGTPLEAFTADLERMVCDIADFSPESLSIDDFTDTSP